MSAILDAAGLTITATMTTPTRPGKRPRPVWEIRGNVKPYADVLRDAGGRPWRGGFSFFDDPTADLEATIPTVSPLSYAEQLAAKAERAEARAERFEERSGRAMSNSAAAFDRADQVASMIPMGQPILVGHHSEKRHRRDADRIHRAMSQGVSEQRRGEYWRGRADAARRTAEGTSDPGFAQRRIEEAEAEIRRLERSRDRWGSTPGLEIGIAEQIQKRDHWRGVLAEAGGELLTRETVHAGDEVNTRHGWALVVRTNQKTVTVRWTRPPLIGMPDAKYPYAELKGHRTRN